jgi:uncharacterized membrane protein
MFIKRFLKKIQQIFFTGLLVTVPTMLCVFLLKWLINYIDQISAPLVNRLLHTPIPGIGFFVTVLLLLLVGLLGTNILGRKLVSLGDQIFSRIPLVKSIYTFAKQIIETLIFATEKPFQQVVLVPYPREDLYAVGLVTRKVPAHIVRIPSLKASATASGPDDEPILSVFIPSTPNFTGGVMVMFPSREVIPLAMTVEEGFTYLMTGGILVPKRNVPYEHLQQLEDWELFLH